MRDRGIQLITPETSLWGGVLYRSFYGLVRRPFDSVPDPEYYFETARTKETFDCLTFSVLQEGVVSLLVGRDGCGKTLLLRRLLTALDESYELAYVSGNLAGNERLLREILYQLGDDGPREERKDELERRLGTRLYEKLEAGRKTLIVFDSVSGMTRETVLAEVRKLLDMQLDDRALTSFLIAGNGGIEAAVSTSNLKERIGVVARVKPLTLLESVSYIDHRLKVAGASRELITSEAKAAVAAAAGGVPGQINTLADLSLFCGYRSGLALVDLRAVESAISRSLTDEIQGSPEKA